MMAANILAAPMLVALMWGIVPHEILLAWLAVLVIACSLTMLFYFYLKPFFKQLKNTPKGLFYYQFPLAFGIIWGAAGYFFFTPSSMVHIAFLIIFLFGMTSGAVSALSSLWLAFIALAVPTLLPFIIRLFMEGYANSYFLGITILIFLVIMITISKLTNRSITRSLTLRYDNLNLLADLEQQKNQAITANKDKSRFLSAASHDLRQPVHALSLLSSAIEPEINTDKGHQVLNQINLANGVMLDLLNSLLDISKLDAELVEAKLQAVNAQQVIDKVVEEFKLLADESGLQLRTHHGDCYIKTDPILLQDIIRNLLQNAIRYTPKGKVLVACRKRQDQVLIQVWDTGKGIATEDQELIFAEFQQLQNPERDHNKGLGLGLAICRRLSKLIGATLSLKSQTGKGSVFTLALPAMSDQAVIEDMAQSIETKARKNSLFNFKQSTILVIDDNQSVLDAMKTLLESWGCQVLTANNIATTIQIAQQYQGHKNSPVDALIADYRLRENTTGVDAMRAFYQHVDYHPARIIITGDTAPDRMQEMTAHGIPVLHKPVNSAHLKNALGSMLRNND